MFYFIDVIYIPMDNIRLPSDDRSQEPTCRSRIGSCWWSIFHRLISSIKIRGYLEKLLVCRNIPKLSQGFTKQQKEPWRRRPCPYLDSRVFSFSNMAAARDEQALCFGVRVKNSRGEGRERVSHPFPKHHERACSRLCYGSLLRHRVSLGSWGF